MATFQQVKTKASLLQTSENDFKFAIYEPRKRKTATSTLKQLNLFKHQQVTQHKAHNNGKAIDWKTAQKDVINLGLSGITNKGKKDQAEIELAIKLGAKPPKKYAVNYKELLEKKHEQKRLEAAKDATFIAKKFESGATQSFQKYGQITTKKNLKKSKKQPTKMLESYGRVKPKSKDKGKNKKNKGSKNLSKVTKRKNKK